jgi:hypothetical protein
MKPFNLQAALAGKPVVTRDGRKVTKIVHFSEAESSGWRVVGIATGEVLPVNEFGSYHGTIDSPKDWFMASEKKEGWVNIWGAGRIPGYRERGYKIFSTQQEAEECAQNTYGDPYFGAVHVEWEE